jgi:flagellar biosynthesis protein FlhF
MFKPQKYEVTAAVDDHSKKKKIAEETKNNVQTELAELKEMVLKMLTQTENEKNDKVVEFKKPSSKSKFKVKLTDRDIPEEIIDELTHKLQEENKELKVNSKIYEKELINSLKEVIETNNNYNGRIQVLVGPTGVGKTTTIAKLASLFTLYKDKKVGLITLDTYRIGAVEQLKTYAEILGIPFEVILSIKDIPKVLKNMEDCEVILVDTMGRNSKNVLQISEIRKFVEELHADKVHLVLSMTTKQKDLKQIISNYKMLNYNSIILTKVDETDIHGAILTSLYYSNVPVSYLSTGQNVPEDIEEANKDKIIKLVMGADE